MVGGTLVILIGLNIVAIPLALYLLSKRDTRHSTRAYRRSF